MEFIKIAFNIFFIRKTYMKRERKIRGWSIYFLKLNSLILVNIKMDCVFSNFQFDVVVINVKFLPEFRLNMFMLSLLYVSFMLSLCFRDGMLKQSLVATNISNLFRVEYRRRSVWDQLCVLFTLFLSSTS